MERQALQKLIEWKESGFEKPLIIRGARQVGKTWLMQTFGERCYSDVIMLNFDKDKELEMIFSDSISPKTLLPQIEILAGKKINPKETLLIFDEVQEVPRALTSLKYFNEDAPEIQIVAAGSLLGIALHHGTSFPVGKVGFLDLYPMTFAEFLEATDRKNMLEVLSEDVMWQRTTFKAMLMECIKEYFLVGGMPRAVAEFADSRDFSAVADIQDEILAAYDQDISKHAPLAEVPRIRNVFASVPGQISKENKKFFYGKIKEGARGKDYELAFYWLSDTGLIHRVYKLADIKMPIRAYEDFNAFKIYMNDIGLLSRSVGLGPDVLLRGDGIFDEFKGALTEQYVLQELIAAGIEPFYWANERGRAEVDFIIQRGTDIVPIEVKSGINLKAKSLKFYMDKYRPEKAIRTSPADYKVNKITYENNKKGTLTDIPLYAFLKEL